LNCWEALKPLLPQRSNYICKRDWFAKARKKVMDVLGEETCSKMMTIGNQQLSTCAVQNRRMNILDVMWDNIDWFETNIQYQTDFKNVSRSSYKPV